MTRAQRILASPRGRFFCANLAFHCATVEGVDQYRRPRTSTDVQAAVRSVDLDHLSAMSEVEVLDALDLEHQRVIAYPLAHEGFPESTLPYRSEGVRWDEWRSHVEAGEARSLREYQRDPHRATSGEWWSIPYAAGAVQTSRACRGLGALQLVAEEDTSIGDEARVWAVSASESARVYEIAAPDDWAGLVDLYPLELTASRRWDWFDTTGRHRRWFIPDWEAVADDYDAVHVSINGYLSGAGIEIPLAAGDCATVLAG